MRKTLVCAAAAAYLGMAGAAVAGGMYEGEGSMRDAPAPMPPIHIWAGLYVGGSLGFGVGDTAGELQTPENGQYIPNDVIPTELEVTQTLGIMPIRPRGNNLDSDFDIDGAIYGAHIGYNWQDGAKVFGIEAAINGTDIDGSALCGPFAIATCEREVNYYATLVGRLGYAVNALHFYAFGGLAYGEVDTNVKVGGFNGVSASRVGGIGGGFNRGFSGSTEHLGWTGGVGIEMALTERFFVGVEYAHVDLGEEDFSIDSRRHSGPIDFACVSECGGRGMSVRDEVDMDFDVIKVRASYKFGDRHEPLESFK